MAVELRNRAEPGLRRSVCRIQYGGVRLSPHGCSRAFPGQRARRTRRGRRARVGCAAGRAAATPNARPAAAAVLRGQSRRPNATGSRSSAWLAGSPAPPISTLSGISSRRASTRSRTVGPTPSPGAIPAETPDSTIRRSGAAVSSRASTGSMHGSSGIRPIEARTVDPQQRMLLETSWQALEDAGMDPGGLEGSRTGVYVGISGSEYRDVIARSGEDMAVLETAGSVAAGRVAFALGPHGSAIPFDMTCASSLAAVHEAVAALHRGEVNLALAGGVNAILSPAITKFFVEVGMLSSTGQCRAFDGAADGYVRGEGCGIVILKRLADAEADGDPIWGVVRGTAVNHNGTSAGLTVPNRAGPGGGDRGRPVPGRNRPGGGGLSRGARHRLGARGSHRGAGRRQLSTARGEISPARCSSGRSRRTSVISRRRRASRGSSSRARDAPRRDPETPALPTRRIRTWTGTGFRFG